MASQRVVNHVFRYGGHLGTYLVVGGVDVKGPQIMQVSADGNSFGCPFTSLGSGSMGAIAVMETEFKDNMTEEEATAMCIKAIEAGVYYDLGSGHNVDVCVINKEGKADFRRNFKHDNHKVFSKPGGYTFNKERVEVLEEYKHKLIVEEGEQPMDLS